MSTAVNTSNLGPRARRAVRFAARFVNPLVLLVAGRRWMPVVGILRHRGRRSGREYATPIGMRPLGDGFVIPRTFSENAAWYQNVKAAGEGSITYLGRHYRVAEPEVVDYATARTAFPRFTRLISRSRTPSSGGLIKSSAKLIASNGALIFSNPGAGS